MDVVNASRGSQPYIRDYFLVLVHFCPRRQTRLWSYPPTALPLGWTRATNPPGCLGGPRSGGFVVQASRKASHRKNPSHRTTPRRQRATSDNQQLQCAPLPPRTLLYPAAVSSRLKPDRLGMTTSHNHPWSCGSLQRKGALLLAATPRCHFSTNSTIMVPSCTVQQP